MRTVRIRTGSAIRLVVVFLVVLCLLYTVVFPSGLSSETKEAKKAKKHAKHHSAEDKNKEYPDFGGVKGSEPKDPLDIDRKVLPDRHESELEFPHIGGNEVDFNEKRNAPEVVKKSGRKPETMKTWDGRTVTLVGRGIDEEVPEPFYRSDGKPGNWEDRPHVDESGHDGPGEHGAAVHTLPEEEEQVKEIIKTFGFNLVNSDKISMDRLPKDLRDKECINIDYPEKLPMVSVVVVFHNEGWGPLVRTFHSVVNRTPPELLGEIVIIDDGSVIKDKPHLGDPLEEYIKRWDGKVKLYRNARREGLIRARSIGAQHAIFEVLVFLDAHCEAGYNWLPPLIAPIARNDRISTVPLIDSIDGQRYTFSGQAGGDHNGRAQGGWEWNFLWKRYPLPKKEAEKLSHGTEMYPSPAMAGGLFAINREHFNNVGMYDPGLEIWGGEQYEISYKLWMCGGGVYFVPCSRVGHVYRLEGWGGNPPPEYVPSNPSFRNYRRVIEVWWDDWTKYFYWNRPELQKLPYGDISEQVKFRHDHCPYNFTWMMEEIAYGITDMYDAPNELLAWGEIRGKGSNICVDSMGHKDNDGPAEAWYCHKQGGNQLFRIHAGGFIAQNLQCIYPASDNSKMNIHQCEKVNSPSNAWKFNLDTDGTFQYKGKCLTRPKDKDKPVGPLTIEDCRPGDEYQLWEVNEEAVL